MATIDSWINHFEDKHGRKPKILHIGNIANNAYQNAKMLNEAGCVCDVLCNDYYQIMSCPEWDDADFTGDYFSTDFPAWHRVDLHGFQRPKWFIQGPFEMCNKLLIAKNHGHILSEILWRRRVASFCKKQSESVANGTTKSSDALKRTTSKHSFVFDKFNTLSCFIKYVAQTFSSSKLFSLRLKRALKKLFMTKDERVEEKKRFALESDQEQQMKYWKLLAPYQKELTEYPCSLWATWAGRRAHN